MLVESLLKASGSSNDTSGVFAGFGERKVLFVTPLRARSRFEGVFCRESKISSSSRLSLVVDEIWGSRLYCDMITWIHCSSKLISM